MIRLRSLIAAVVALALVATGCGGNDGGTDTSTATSGAPKLAATQELSVGFTEDQYVLEGPETGLGAYPLNVNVYETLTYLTPDYQVKPGLAERWEFRAPNTWRFYLRKGVVFHDGQPLTAQAVKTGMFDRVATRRGGGTIKAGPESAVVVDDSTIDFTPTGPNLRVPEQIVHPSNFIPAPGSEPGKKPVGTGPFRFVEYQPKERIVVEANPDYWGDKPTLTKITFRFYPDSETRRLALESGNIDLAYQVPRPDVENMAAKGFRIEKSKVGAYRTLYSNIHGTAPYDLLADPKVRKAVAMGIDREALVEGVLDGLATTDPTWVPPSSLGKHRSAIKGVDYDLAGAKKLLDDAGWAPGASGIRAKDGRPLKLKLVSGFPSAEIHRPVPTYLQAELKKIGVDVEIVERPDSASFQALIGSGEGDLFLEEGNQNDANPGFLPVLLLYTGGTGSSANYQKLFAPGPTFDQLIAPALTAPDIDGVRKAVAEALHEAIDVQNVLIPLAGVFRIYGMREQVQGFVAHPSFLNVQWSGVSLAES